MDAQSHGHESGEVVDLFGGGWKLVLLIFEGL